MRSNFVLYGIYQFLKLLVRIALALYYPQTRVTGREHLKLKGPTLLTTNHPNTLIDALNGASRVDEQVFFIVNASLFQTPFQRWFFTTFYCIPIERPQDTKGRQINNKEAFAQCNDHLRKGGHLFIAPEGTSVLERQLRPLKTGTARIGFSAEQENGFQLGVRILPVCFNYEKPNKFGTRLLVNVGEPILFNDFEAAYAADARQTVKRVTGLLEDRMRRLLIDTHGEEEDRLVRCLETVLRNEIPDHQEAQFHRTKRLIASLRRIQLERPEEYRAFNKQVDAYFAQLDRQELDDRVLSRAVNDRPIRLRTAALGLLLGLPAFLYGLINNFFPYFIPKWINRRLNLYIGYHATVKILAGLLTFPLFYSLQTWLIASLAAWPLPLLYFISLIPLGYFAHWYPDLFRNVRARRQWKRIKSQHPELAEKLIRERRAIWERVKAGI